MADAPRLPAILAHTADNNLNSHHCLRARCCPNNNEPDAGKKTKDKY